jgi:hypothetical protein
MKFLKTDIQIEASPETVWSILTSLDQYTEWNPFIRKAEGKVRVGEKLKVNISPPNGKEMIFNPTVKSIILNVEFSWLGRFLFPGIFDGRHIFTITKNEAGCLLEQKEKFSGLLVPIMWGNLEKNTREGFELMNNALKQRAENANT